VVIASSTRTLTGGLFECRNLGTVALKGFAENVSACQVLARRSRAEKTEETGKIGTHAERRLKAAGDNRHGHRDQTMILLAFRHGLRVSELCDLSRDTIDFTRSTLMVRRAKVGAITGAEVAGDGSST